MDPEISQTVCAMILAMSFVLFGCSLLFYMKAKIERGRARLEIIYARRTKNHGERLLKHSDEVWASIQERETQFWGEFARAYGKATGQTFTPMPAIFADKPPPRGSA